MDNKFEYLRNLQKKHEALWDEMRAGTLKPHDAKELNNHFGKQLKYVTTMLAVKHAEKEGIKIDFVDDEKKEPA